MAKITRAKDLNEAFNLVQLRMPFAYHHSATLRFFYQPVDERMASLIVASASDYPTQKDYKEVMVEMGIFPIAQPLARFVKNGWKCMQFHLERKRLTI